MPLVNSFNLKSKIIFGHHSLNELPNAGRNFGPRVMVVTGKRALIRNGIIQRVESLLQNSGFSPLRFAEVEPEPSLDTVTKGLRIAREEEIDWIVGIGGGSAMDVAKTIAGLAQADRELEYYFEGGPLVHPALPLVTIPTTAGSGAEVTFNAVLSDLTKKVKKSIRDPRLGAEIAIVDPQLTLGLPPDVTVHSGMDALVQAIESFTSKGASPLTDIYAYSAIRRLSANIIKVYQDGQDQEARAEMAMGSLMAGIALSNARLGAVHGMAHSIGILSGKPHGLVCAVLLVPVMRFNLAVSFEKYAEVSKALGLKLLPNIDPIDAAAAGMKFIMNLQRKLGIPSHINDLGISEADYPTIIQESLNSGSMKANPRDAGPEDLMHILKGDI
ncbi:MAG: iron-containing alcohol dehydrogenase family protein [Bacillota bacterium]